MTNLQKWATLNSRLVLNTQWCKVRQDQVELPNGKIVEDYFVNVKPDIALILPITQEKEVVFVRQYRHGVGEILLELPAGTFNPQLEDSMTAAARELEEETGYFAQQLIKIATLFDNPVKDTNKIHLFLANNAYLQGKQKLDTTEEIEVVLMPIEQVKKQIYNQNICVSGTIAALFIGLDYLSQI